MRERNAHQSLLRERPGSSAQAGISRAARLGESPRVQKSGEGEFNVPEITGNDVHTSRTDLLALLGEVT
jgi:hypothetical protein